ncbi:hypothetical protein [Mesorhizobium sp. CAU 1741]|uniref:hypothetical protein n=1 Tax=Mesorhizobium sp. CAU 1741 TaxID=3140366 RepID=UPI00325C25A2
MAIDDDWEAPRSNRGRGVGEAGMGALRVTLLFGSAAVALALILTPIVEQKADDMAFSPYPQGAYPPGLDMMATGTVGQRSSGTYVVRRSVLQPTPNSVCVIRENGMRTGDC